MYNSLLEKRNQPLALGLVFQRFLSFSDDRNELGMTTDDQCYQFRVIEVIPSSFRSSENDGKSSNTSPRGGTR